MSFRTSQNVTVQETPVQKPQVQRGYSSVTFRIFVSASGARTYVRVGWKAGNWEKSENKGSRRYRGIVIKKRLCLDVEMRFPWASFKCLHTVP